MPATEVSHLPPLNDAAVSQTQVVSGTRQRVLISYFQQKDAQSYLDAIGVTDSAGAVASHRKATTDSPHAPRDFAPPAVSQLADHPHLAALMAEPTFQEFGARATSRGFALIELGDVLACQPKVDWDHVQSLAARCPQVGDHEGLLRFCLPLQSDSAGVQAKVSYNPGTNTFTWFVDNPDVRICGPVQAPQAETGRTLVGFALGPGLHQMSVTKLGDRFMLSNGYHRAVALLKAGHSMVPVVLCEVNAVEFTPTARPGMFSPPIVLGPKPPRIADFLCDAALTTMARKQRRMFSVHAEMHILPE